MSRPVRHEIPPRSGAAFTLDRGQRLTVIDPQGEQVADLVAFRRDDLDEVISSGRTIDYASRIFLTTGDPIYSNRSNVLLRIVEDTVGRHDFLLTPARPTPSGSSTATNTPTGVASAIWPKRWRPTESSRTASRSPSTCSCMSPSMGRAARSRCAHRSARLATG